MTKKKDNEIDYIEQLLTELDGSHRNRKKSKGPVISESSPKDFEIYNIVEHEIVRLRKMDHLISNQINFCSEMDQSALIIKDLEEEVRDLKGKLIKTCSVPDSIFYSNMKKIFNTSFLSNKKSD